MASNNAPPKDLVALGFEEASQDIPNRLLVGSDGMEKSGKSNFWMTAPGPIAGINLDIGLEGVIHRHSANKKMWILTYNLPPISTQADWHSHYVKIRKAYEAAINHKDVRTVVIDTGSDMWDLTLLTEFGTLTPQTAKGSLAFASANSTYRSLIRMAYDTDKNLIITHKLGKEWGKVTEGGKTSNVWTGKYQREGFRESDYLIQCNVRHYFHRQIEVGGKELENQFSMEILNCRQNFDLAGYTFDHKQCTFQDLGMAVFEGTTRKDWM